MARLFPYLMGGLAAIALTELAPATVNKALSMAGSSAQHNPQLAQVSAARRKGDRLDRSWIAANPPDTHSPDIATVELIGLRQTAIVYRDRDGHELFRTDPLKNVTVVAKGLVLPSVTVKERGDSPVTPLPIAPSVVPAREPKGPAFGCESSFSPVAAPSMAHLTGRCMASLGSGVVIALADQRMFRSNRCASTSAHSRASGNPAFLRWVTAFAGTSAIDAAILCHRNML